MLVSSYYSNNVIVKRHKSLLTLSIFSFTAALIFVAVLCLDVNSDIYYVKGTDTTSHSVTINAFDIETVLQNNTDIFTKGNISFKLVHILSSNDKILFAGKDITKSLVLDMMEKDGDFLVLIVTLMKIKADILDINNLKIIIQILARMLIKM